MIQSQQTKYDWLLGPEQNSKAKETLQIIMGGCHYDYNKNAGIIPRLSWEFRRRVNAKKALNVIATGEAGVSKSYTLIQMARPLSPIKPLDINTQIVFSYSEFMNALLKLPPGAPIVFDEPQYAISHREWYKQINQALARTVGSMRFKLHPLFMPVISSDLLDKEVRDYFIQYQIMLRDRGQGTAYRCYHNEFEHKVMYNTICEIELGLMDNRLCNKASCLTCSEMPKCPYLRAQYERKKDEIQEQRYKQELEESTKEESKKLTQEELVDFAVAVANKFVVKNKIKWSLLIEALRSTYNVHLNHTRAYQLKTVLEQTHPEILKDAPKTA